MYDLAIIGAGVIGSALAYTLSAYDLRILLIEKENDVAMGASRANTALIHAGFDPLSESLMGQLNVEGMRRCYELCRELDVEHRNTGAMVLAFSKEEEETLEVLFQRGLANGCRGLEIISGQAAREKEPHLSGEVFAALWAPEAGVINPWEFTLAMAEVAVRNGAELRLNTEVTGLAREGTVWRIETGGEDRGIRARFLVNAAGVESDRIHNMAAPPAFQILPTRGQYYLLDRTVGPLVHSILFNTPTRAGKGVTVSPTIHDNFLIGPDSEIICDRTDTGVTRSALDEIARLARRIIPSLDVRSSIRNFAGVRANSCHNDFFIDMAAEGFLDLAAIKSPGLTAAPAIARLARDLLEEAGLSMTKKEKWTGGRKVVRFKEIPEAERETFIRDHPLYGRVICRCEAITEGEIVAAMQREIPPVSVDGMKRRAGTGMGRCQGGFCGPRVLEIMARETGRDPLEIEEDGRGSYILTGRTKE